MAKKNNIPSFFSARDKKAAADKRTKLYRVCNGIKPDKIKDKRPVTEAQAKQQLRFRTAIAFTKTLAQFTAIGFSATIKEMTATNIATRQVLKEAIIGEYPDYSIDCSKVIISSGRYPGLLQCAIELTLEGSVVATWTETLMLDNFTDSADPVFLSVYNATRKICHNYAGAACRGDKLLHAPLPDFSTSDIYHCWIFVASPNLRKVSKSLYFNFTPSV